MQLQPKPELVTCAMRRILNVERGTEHSEQHRPAKDQARLGRSIKPAIRAIHRRTPKIRYAQTAGGTPFAL